MLLSLNFPTLTQLINNVADYKLSTDDDILNRTRFVLSLDNDQHLSNHYDNGVFISAETHAKALGVIVNFKQSVDDFSADPAVKAFLQSINKTLITREEALYILESGLEEVYRGSIRHFNSINEDPNLYEGLHLPTWAYLQDSFQTADLEAQCLLLKTTLDTKYTLCFDSTAVSTIGYGGKVYPINRWGIDEDGAMVVIAKHDTIPTQRWYLKLMLFQASKDWPNSGVAVETIGCPQPSQCAGIYNIEWTDEI